MARVKQRRPPSKDGYSHESAKARPKPIADWGGFYIREYRGRLVIQKKHKPPHPSTNQTVRMWNTWLRLANWLYKVTHPHIKWQYRAQAKGIWLQPRDIFTANLAGTMFYLTTEDGQHIWPRRARTIMTKSLDILTSAVGALLVRGTEYWQGLTPGPEGTVLTSQGPDRLPVWQTPAGSGGTATARRSIAYADEMAALSKIDFRNLKAIQFGTWPGYYLSTYLMPTPGATTTDIKLNAQALDPQQTGGIVLRLTVTDATPDHQIATLHTEDRFFSWQGIDELTTYTFPDIPIPQGTTTIAIRIERITQDQRDDLNTSLLVTSVEAT